MVQWWWGWCCSTGDCCGGAGTGGTGGTGGAADGDNECGDGGGDCGAGGDGGDLRGLREDLKDKNKRKAFSHLGIWWRTKTAAPQGLTVGKGPEISSVSRCLCEPAHHSHPPVTPSSWTRYTSQFPQPSAKTNSTLNTDPNIFQQSDVCKEPFNGGNINWHNNNVCPHKLKP